MEQHLEKQTITEQYLTTVNDHDLVVLVVDMEFVVKVHLRFIDRTTGDYKWPEHRNKINGYLCYTPEQTATAVQKLTEAGRELAKKLNSETNFKLFF